MTTSERGLVEGLRAELASIDPPRRCCRAAELAGLAGAFEPRRRTIARLELRLIRTLAAQTPGGAAAKSVSGVASLPSPASDAAPATPAPIDWSRAPEHCRVAYLRGRFLAHGSLSLAGGRTHLEFVLPVEEAKELTQRLEKLGMPATWRIRRGRGVVTWKSVETVGMFLRVVGASASLLELEARQVSRSVRGELNRVINAESANLQRAVAAAARQLEAIDTLEADGRLAEQPYVVRVVADARREEPEATLTELAERLELHRSSVQRALERMERLALNPDDEVGKRRPTRSRHRARSAG